MRWIHRRLLSLALIASSRPKTTLATAFIALAVCVTLAIFNLKISANQNELFSSREAHFRDYLQFIEKFPENEALYVVIQKRSAHTDVPVRTWTNIADELHRKLTAMPQYVHLVESRVKPADLGIYGFSFEEPAYRRGTFDDFIQFSGLLNQIVQKPGTDRLLLGATPLERFLSVMQLAAISDPNTFAESGALVSLIADSATSAVEHHQRPIAQVLPDLTSLDNESPRRLGYFYERDATDLTRWLMLVRVYPKTDYSSLTAISRTVEAIRAAAQSIAADYPMFSVGLTGRPALEADEMRTTDTDAHRAETIAMIVVLAGILVVLKSFRLTLVSAISLVIAIGWTFGWATLAVGQLNLLSTVFVIAQIGIGMDYFVQILARYQQQAGAIGHSKTSWPRIYHTITPPIFTTCLGAAGAFLVATLTDFRGAAELGIIAGGGLLLCLLAGYTVLPALLTLWPGQAGHEPPNKMHQPMPQTVGWKLWLAPVAWVVALLAAMPLMWQVRFDPDLLTLQAPNLESVQLIRKLQTWSAVVMTHDLETLRIVRNALAASPVIGSTDSILHAYDTADWLRINAASLPAIHWTAPAPIAAKDLQKLSARAEALSLSYRKIGQTTTADSLNHLSQQLKQDVSQQVQTDAASRLSQWQSGWIGQLQTLAAQFNPPRVDVDALPPELRSHYISKDGTWALYIYPAADLDLWQAEPLARFTTDIESRLSHIHGDFTITGIAPNIFHTTTAISRSFKSATAMALLLIVLLIWIDLRNLSQTLGAVGVLLLGLPMLWAVMALSGTTWNFANFFGLPILIGAGHEYGVFTMHRYREARRHRQRGWPWWDASDRALFLCAFITSSSFGFFYLLGHHQGLKSLGWVMAIGTLCIYMAAVIVLRPILQWKLHRYANCNSQKHSPDN